MGRPKSGMEVPCPVCGKLIYRPTCSIKQGRKYCSRVCYDKIHDNRVTKTCGVCHKLFSVPTSNANRFIVCSLTCRLADTRYLNCKRCSKRFRCSEKRYDRYYCSEICRRPPILVSCKTCGVELRKQPNDHDRAFCCFSCYRKYNGETSIEKAVRESLIRLQINFIQEHKIGRYSIDFAIGYTALEVDGEYWHKDILRDATKTLFLQLHGWRVIRITQKEIESTNDLDKLIHSKLVIENTITVFQ